MYGVPRATDRLVRETRYGDSFRTSIDGRTVVVTNAVTVIEAVLSEGGRASPVGVCAAELPAVVLPLCVQSRRFQRIVNMPDVPTGNPAFDSMYRINGSPDFVRGLTPPVQQRIMARDDWVFWIESYLFACVTKGAFRSPDEAMQRVSDVLGILTAIPESVLPRQVDHSQDNLVAQISQLNSVEDAMAWLQGLSDADRQRLAQSNTPLAAFADVRTPQEAISKFESLDQQRRLQLLAIFMRVTGNT